MLRLFALFGHTSSTFLESLLGRLRLMSGNAATHYAHAIKCASVLRECSSICEVENRTHITWTHHRGMQPNLRELDTSKLERHHRLLSATTDP